MSAFVVEDSTLDKILAGIQYTQYGHDNYAPFPGFLGKRWETILNGAVGETLDQLGKRLRQMNETAVYQRYSHNEPEQMIPSDKYTYNPAMSTPKPVELYKAVRCLIYQCTEGDVMESELYQELDKWCDAIAHRIVCNLPQWQEATWG